MSWAPSGKMSEELHTQPWFSRTKFAFATFDELETFPVLDTNLFLGALFR